MDVPLSGRETEPMVVLHPRRSVLVASASVSAVALALLVVDPHLAWLALAGTCLFWAWWSRRRIIVGQEGLVVKRLLRRPQTIQHKVVVDSFPITYFSLRVYKIGSGSTNTWFIPALFPGHASVHVKAWLRENHAAPSDERSSRWLTTQ